MIIRSLATLQKSLKKKETEIRKEIVEVLQKAKENRKLKYCDD